MPGDFGLAASSIGDVTRMKRIGCVFVAVTIGAMAFAPAASYASAAPTKAQVRASLLTLPHRVPDPNDAGPDQDALCGVVVPSPRFTTSKGWESSPRRAQRITVAGSEFSGAKKAREAVRAAYNSEQACRRWHQQETRFPLSRFTLHVGDTVAYCDTLKAVVAKLGSWYENECRFVDQTVRYTVVTRPTPLANHDHLGLLKALTARAIKKAHSTAAVSPSLRPVPSIIFPGPVFSISHVTHGCHTVSGRFSSLEPLGTKALLTWHINGHRHKASVHLPRVRSAGHRFVGHFQFSRVPTALSGRHHIDVWRNRGHSWTHAGWTLLHLPKATCPPHAATRVINPATDYLTPPLPPGATLSYPKLEPNITNLPALPKPNAALRHVSVPIPAPGFGIRWALDVTEVEGTMAHSYWADEFYRAKTDPHCYPASLTNPPGWKGGRLCHATGPEGRVFVTRDHLQPTAPGQDGRIQGNVVIERDEINGRPAYVTLHRTIGNPRATRTFVYFRVGSLRVEVFGGYGATTTQLMKLAASIHGLSYKAAHPL